MTDYVVLKKISEILLSVYESGKSKEGEEPDFNQLSKTIHQLCCETEENLSKMLNFDPSASNESNRLISGGAPVDDELKRMIYCHRLPWESCVDENKKNVHMLKVGEVDDGITSLVDRFGKYRSAFLPVFGEKIGKGGKLEVAKQVSEIRTTGRYKEIVFGVYSNDLNNRVRFKIGHCVETDWLGKLVMNDDFEGVAKKMPNSAGSYVAQSEYVLCTNEMYEALLGVKTEEDLRGVIMKKEYSEEKRFSVAHLGRTYDFNTKKPPPQNQDKYKSSKPYTQTKINDYIKKLKKNT